MKSLDGLCVLALVAGVFVTPNGVLAQEQTVESTTPVENERCAGYRDSLSGLPLDHPRRSLLLGLMDENGCAQAAVDPSQVAALTSRLAELEAEVATTARALEESEAQAAQLATDLDAAESALVAALEEAEARPVTEPAQPEAPSADLTELQQQLEQVKMRGMELETELTASQQQLESTAALLAQSEASLGDTQQQLGSTAALLEQSEAGLRDTQQQLETARVALSQAEVDLGLQRDIIDQTDQQLRAAQDRADAALAAQLALEMEVATFMSAREADVVEGFAAQLGTLDLATCTPPTLEIRLGQTALTREVVILGDVSAPEDRDAILAAVPDMGFVVTDALNVISTANLCTTPVGAGYEIGVTPDGVPETVVRAQALNIKDLLPSTDDCAALGQLLQTDPVFAQYVDQTPINQQGFWANFEGGQLALCRSTLGAADFQYDRQRDDITPYLLLLVSDQ